MENSIFEYVRNTVSDSIPSLKEIFSHYNWERLDIDKVLGSGYSDGNSLIIDARSENEFEESHIPNAINFPVLNNFERHNVGLIYKKYSQSAAVWLAMQYADPKTEKLKPFLDQISAGKKKIIVYCWRGGGRSSYLAKMVSDLGFQPLIITGGFKSYRHLVNSFFKLPKLPFGLIELTGLTGSGKSELIRAARDFIPVIDLENSARHYSSLFGYVPYQIKGIEPVKNQSAFENNIFADVVNGISEFGIFHQRHLIESESRKIGNFVLPDIIRNDLETCPSILVKSSLESRVKRIVKDYFGNENKGIEPMLKIFISGEKYFREKLSNEIYNQCKTALENGDVYKFTELMIKKYYDVRYKRKNKRPVAEITNENLREGLIELKAVLASSEPDNHIIPTST